MKKYFSYFLLVVVVVLVITGIFFLRSSQNEERLPLKVGVILPLSGNLAVTGEAVKNGMLLATEEFDPHQKNIAFLFEDSQGSTEKAVSSYKKLTQIDGAYVITDTFSRELAAIVPLAENDKVIVLSQFALASFIDKAGDYIFKLAEQNSDHAAALVNVMKKRGDRKIASLVARDEYCTDVYGLLRKKAQKEDIEISSEEKFDLNSVDVKSQLLKIKQTNPQGLFACGFNRDLGNIFKQANELGMKIQFYTTTPFESPAIFEIVDRDLLEGVIYSIVSFDCSDGHSVQYCKLYKERYEKQPDYRSAFGYDTVGIITAALNSLVKSRREIDLTNIKDALLDIHNYRGVAGEISLDSEGNAKRSVMLKTVKDGKFVKLENE